MAENYRQMWTELGLDLPAHDALLNVLGQSYGEYMHVTKKPSRGDAIF